MLYKLWAIPIKAKNLKKNLIIWETVVLIISFDSIESISWTKPCGIAHKLKFVWHIMKCLFFLFFWRISEKYVLIAFRLTSIWYQIRQIGCSYINKIVLRKRHVIADHNWISSFPFINDVFWSISDWNLI
jgi:hypothetical protein